MENTAAEYVAQRMPNIGIGTFQMRSESVLYDVIRKGLAMGYRLIDTAQCYGNEPMIGRILKRVLDSESTEYVNLKRSDIFITSKISPANQGKEKVQKSVQRSLERLQTEYLDLVLVHWPGASKYEVSDPRNKELRRETWLELERLHKEGSIRAIGVSNYTILHLKELFEYARVLPAVNQYEYHPFFAETNLLDFCKQNGIHFQAYSSFGSPQGVHNLFNGSQIIANAQKRNISVAQFLLAWSLNQGISVLPRTRNLDHLAANWKSQEVKLSTEEIESVRCGQNASTKYCWNPSSVA
ncbi:hypothetical protein QR680_013119 [Steinernema hermaphroditum]|uniref:NADP-dependent oxidoreductase domain-containing protein n=1 Tax=Steinernema hermaphroditum TaxID=289476 RepID=A0AA39I6G6_9BILA|nr:hypothetical protein QR680_013119 [Steinernema hermaphroditum]